MIHGLNCLIFLKLDVGVKYSTLQRGVLLLFFFFFNVVTFALATDKNINAVDFLCGQLGYKPETTPFTLGHGCENTA